MLEGQSLFIVCVPEIPCYDMTDGFLPPSWKQGYTRQRKTKTTEYLIGIACDFLGWWQPFTELMRSVDCVSGEDNPIVDGIMIKYGNSCRYLFVDGLGKNIGMFVGRDAWCDAKPMR
jgi:hypothetical protein